MTCSVSLTVLHSSHERHGKFGNLILAFHNLDFRKIRSSRYLRHGLGTESDPRCRVGILTYDRYYSGRLYPTLHRSHTLRMVER
jgi:hypothetical protein